MLYELIRSLVVVNSTWFIEDQTVYDHLPLFSLLFYIQYLPFEWRKWILDACRIQESMKTNAHLLKFLDPPGSITIISGRGSSISVDKNHIASLFENFYDVPITCSLISYFTRAESTTLPWEADTIKQQTIDKEISAALVFVSGLHQVSDYSWIGSSSYNACHSLFNRGLRSYRTTLSRHTTHLLYPYYNGKKNVGRETAEWFIQRTNSPLLPSAITSLDLIKHYHWTGIKTPGPMEMRIKWTYNDLKPRVYYALGGDALFAGMYIQAIANRICEILPSTNPHSRADVTRIHIISSEELLITYDYTSFTTSLSELKYFLHALALEFMGVQVDVLDVHSGITSIDLGEYLMAYNHHANQHQAFDCRRLFPDQLDGIYHQGRGGSLGTQGNITFSTVNHGINLSSFTETPWEDSCVGDDALTAIRRHLLPLFISHTQTLGEIHPEKFTTWQADPTDPTLANRQQFKYLKRPLTVDFTGTIRTGVLDAFPDLATMMFPQGDSFRGGSDEGCGDRLRNFCMQWGRFCTRHRLETVGLSYSPQEDLMLIVGSVRCVYVKYGLPEEGAIPGMRFHNIDRGTWDEISFFAPPCDDLSVFTEDWALALYSRYAGEYISKPVTTSERIPPEEALACGVSFRATLHHPLVKIMEALGYFACTLVTVQVPFDSVELIRLLEISRSSAGEKRHMLAEVDVLVDVPDWYLDAYMYYLSDIHVGDPLEARSDYDTILSV